MIRLAVLIFLLLAVPASAQSAVRMPGKIILSQELVEAIAQRLAQDPYSTVAPLIARIQAEAAQQVAPAPPAAPAEAPKEPPAK